MDIHLLPAVEIRRRFVEGELSAEEITQAFLHRIDEYDKEIQSLVTVFHERALEKARALDQKKANGEPLGRLAAIPVIVKDNIHVRGETTTCSSKFLTNYTAPFDATVTQLIEKEDGILLGKANLDEFAMGGTTENSALFPTKNPWDTSRSPGGSSGGSAASVAARFAPLSLGSDTGGSVRLPASYCGLVGFKPTYGRVSRYGLVAFGSSLDQIGPLATNVKDAALLMEVIGKHCEYDSTSLPTPSEEYLDQLESRSDLKGLKVGIPRSLLKDLSGEPKRLFEESVQTLEKLGATTTEVDLDLMRYSIAMYYILATAEASTNLARFDGVRYGQRSKEAQTLDEVYTLSKEEGYGDEVKRRILLGTYVLSAGYQDAYYKKAQKVRTRLIEQFKKAFEAADILALPVVANVAPKLDSYGDPLSMYLQDLFTTAANLAGVPAISLPAGLTDEKLPFGLQLIGPQKADRFVFEVAYQFEKECSLKECPKIA